MYGLDAIQRDVICNFIAMVNQRQLIDQQNREMHQSGRTSMDSNFQLHVNWPTESLRKTISTTTLAQLTPWFQNTFPALADVRPFFPIASFRYEVARSGSTDSVCDLKISPIRENNSSETAMFNYHVKVVEPTTGT